MHHRRQIAHLLGEFLANTADTPQQLAILLKIDHRNQPVTHFHAQRIFQLDIGPAGFRGLGILLHDGFVGGFRRLFFAPAQPPGQPEQRGGKQQENQVRHPRHQPQQPKYRGTQQHDLWVIE